MARQRIPAAASPSSTAVLDKYPKSWLYIRWTLFILYAYASFAPGGALWGFHFLAYLPVWSRLLLLSAGALLLLPSIHSEIARRLSKYLMNRTGADDALLPILGICLVGLVLFLAFPIRTDAYGDTINMIKWYGDNHEFHWSWITAIFDFNVIQSKEALTVGLHRIVSWAFEIPIDVTYRTVSAICGALFILVWLRYAQKVSSGLLRIVLSSLGLFAGAIQIFFGHVENYSFAVLTSTLFLFCLYFYLYDRASNAVFILSYVLTVKAHIIGALFFPALLLAIAYRYRDYTRLFATTLTWSAALKRVILPSIGIGIALYFFVFHSWNEPYALAQGRQFQQTFLPIVPMPGPLQHYSLWSPYHIADFLNVLAMTAGPVLILLITLLVFNRRQVVWSCPIVIVFGAAALFPFLFFLAMNPTLSPVRDWDVYTLLFPPLLFFASVIMTHSTVRDYVASWIISPIVFGAIFTTATVSVNATPRAVDKRLQDVGLYTYRSYYAGAAFLESRALASSDERGVPKSFQEVIGHMHEGTVRGNDGELANMMARLSSFYASAGDRSEAIRWGEAATQADTTDTRYAQNLAVSYISVGRAMDAARILTQLQERVRAGDTSNVKLEILAKSMDKVSEYYLRQGQDSIAIDWAQNAYRMDPHSLEALYDLANCYMNTSKIPDALRTLQLVPADALSTDMLTDMAIAAYALYGPDSAMPYLERAKRMAPGDRTVDSLYQALSKRGRRSRQQ